MTVGLKVTPRRRACCCLILSIFSARGTVLASVDSDRSSRDFKSSNANVWLSRKSLRHADEVPAFGAVPKAVVRNLISMAYHPLDPVGMWLRKRILQM